MSGIHCHPLASHHTDMVGIQSSPIIYLPMLPLRPNHYNASQLCIPSTSRFRQPAFLPLTYCSLFGKHRSHLLSHFCFPRVDTFLRFSEEVDGYYSRHRQTRLLWDSSVRVLDPESSSSLYCCHSSPIGLYFFCLSASARSQSLAREQNVYR